MRCFLLYVALIAYNTCCVAQKDNSTEQIYALLDKAKVFTEKGQFDSVIQVSFRALERSQQQQNAECKARSYYYLSEANYQTGKPEKMLQYDSLLLPLARQLKDTFLLASAYSHIAIYNMGQGRNKEAEALFRSILKLDKYPAQQADVHSNLGSLYMQTGKNAEALDWFYKALRLYEKSNNEEGQGRTNSNISSLLFMLNRKTEAISYQKRSVAIREKINDRQGLVIAYTNLAQIYVSQDSFAHGKHYQEKAIDNAEQLKNPKLMAAAYAGMAALYNKQKNVKEALYWQSKAINMFEEQDNKPVLSRLYVSAATNANTVGDSIKAIQYYTKALGLAKSLQNKENISNAYLGLSTFYENHHDYQSAYEQYRNYILYRDSISDNGVLSEIEEIKTRYETEKKDAEIQKLNNERTIQQLELEKQQALAKGNLLEAQQKQQTIDLLERNQELQDLKIAQQDEAIARQKILAEVANQKIQLAAQEKQLNLRKLQNQDLLRNIIIVSFLLLLLLLAAIFNRYRLKRRLEQQQFLLQERNRISGELHDEVGSVLSAINILSHTARMKLGQNTEKSGEMLDKIHGYSQKMMDAMGDIVWSINPKNDTFSNMIVRMKEHAAEILEAKNIAFSFTTDKQLDHLKLSPEKRRDLYLIFKEALNNLVKYSGATEAHINFGLQNDLLRMSVSDNGKGFDAELKKSGNGLHTMTERALRHLGSLMINGQKGTTVKLDMPVTQF
jgi:signal transduction histidine kinase/tetratricopeptide (TPR) repeat protein